MGIIEVVLSMILTAGFGFISNKMDKLEAKIEAVEDDLHLLAMNIERRAKFVRKTDEPDDA